LSKDDAPFILMVEAASIDKQSHPNHASGVIWDVIEFDKAIALGRAFDPISGTGQAKTLVLVSADHDQSMSIIGTTDSANTNGVLNTRSNSLYPRTIAAFDPKIGNGPAPGNAGSNTGEVSGFPDYTDQAFSGGVYPNNTNQFKIAVGFRTGNHTGSSVPITADGPGSLLFAGYFDQTDIFFKMARVLASNTAPLDQFLGTRASFRIIEQNY
jgi:alkaline phosphatase